MIAPIVTFLLAFVKFSNIFLNCSFLFPRFSLFGFKFYYFIRNVFYCRFFNFFFYFINRSKTSHFKMFFICFVLIFWSCYCFFPFVNFIFIKSPNLDVRAVAHPHKVSNYYWIEESECTSTP